MQVYTNEFCSLYLKIKKIMKKISIYLKLLLHVNASTTKHMSKRYDAFTTHEYIIGSSFFVEFFYYSVVLFGCWYNIRFNQSDRRRLSSLKGRPKF